MLDSRHVGATAAGCKFLRQKKEGRLTAAFFVICGAVLQGAPQEQLLTCGKPFRRGR